MTSSVAAWTHGRLRCANAVHTRTFDDELVILDLARGEYFSLDRVGACLWTGLEAGRTLDQIAREIVEEYDVSLETVTRDLVALGNNLVAQGFLVHEPPSGQP